MFAIKFVQPEGHPKPAGDYAAEILRAAANRVENQPVIEESFIYTDPDTGRVMYEWTTVEAPPPEPEPEPEPEE